MRRPLPDPLLEQVAIERHHLCFPHLRCVRCGRTAEQIQGAPRTCEESHASGDAGCAGCGSAPPAAPEADSTQAELLNYVIYQRPKDWPQYAYVVRRWRVVPGVRAPLADIRPWALTQTIQLARASIPPGLVLLPRSPEDDPVIVETWL